MGKTATSGGAERGFQSIPESNFLSLRDFEEKFTAFYLAEETYLGQCSKSQLGQACCGEAECKDADIECCS